MLCSLISLLFDYIFVLIRQIITNRYNLVVIRDYN